MHPSFSEADRPVAIVTCGPAQTPIDRVRCITNASSGELGVLLTERLLDQGWQVVCLKGSASTYRDPEGKNLRLYRFKTNRELMNELNRVLHPERVRVVFHAAALTDFEVAKVSGPLGNVRESGKISSDCPEVQIILKPGIKVLPMLPKAFPNARIVGWKFELDGGREAAIRRAQDQISQNGTYLSVVNGDAYGAGFGLVDQTGLLAHWVDRQTLSEGLLPWVVR